MLRLELEPRTASSPHDFCVGEYRDESADALALPHVEPEGVLRILGPREVTEVALASELHVPAGEDTARYHILGVAVGGLYGPKLLGAHARSSQASRG